MAIEKELEWVGSVGLPESIRKKKQEICEENYCYNYWVLQQNIFWIHGQNGHPKQPWMEGETDCISPRGRFPNSQKQSAEFFFILCWFSRPRFSSGFPSFLYGSILFPFLFFAFPLSIASGQR